MLILAFFYGLDYIVDFNLMYKKTTPSLWNAKFFKNSRYGEAWWEYPLSYPDKNEKTNDTIKTNKNNISGYLR